MNILLIDDDEIILGVLSKILQKDGHNVVIGKDGIEGLHHLDLMRYDLVITDIMMPYLNGFELIEALKKHPNTKNAKVIVISAFEHERLMREGLMSEIDNYIEKPILLGNFKTKVDEISSRIS